MQGLSALTAAPAPRAARLGRTSGQGGKQGSMRDCGAGTTTPGGITVQEVMGSVCILIMTSLHDDVESHIPVYGVSYIIL